MLIAGVVPPDEAIGLVPVTEVTVPTDTEPPRLIADPLIVIELFTKALLGIEVRLAPDPLNVVAVIFVPVIARGVVPPMTMLLIVPDVAGLIVTVPEPVGARLTFLLAGLTNKPPLTVTLPLPPPSQFKRLVPPDVRKLPPKID